MHANIVLKMCACVVLAVMSLSWFSSCAHGLGRAGGPLLVTVAQPLDVFARREAEPIVHLLNLVLKSGMSLLRGVARCQTPISPSRSRRTQKCSCPDACLPLGPIPWSWCPNPARCACHALCLYVLGASKWRACGDGRASCVECVRCDCGRGIPDNGNVRRLQTLLRMHQPCLFI